jgi:hypothetical protein
MKEMEWRTWLLTRVKVGPIRAPAWGMLALLVGAACTFTFLNARPQTSPPSFRSAPSIPLPVVSTPTPGLSTSDAAISPSPSSPDSAPDLFSLARAGDVRSMKVLESENHATEGSILALLEGRLVAKRIAMSTLRRDLQMERDLGQNGHALRILRDAALDSISAVEALTAMTELGSTGIDLLDDVASRLDDGSEIEIAGAKLLQLPSIRAKASEVLRVKLDLEYAKSCEERRQALVRAIASGDERALAIVEKLGVQTGCGADLQSDCHPCLRTDDTLERAREAVRTRKRPRF